MGVGSYGYLYKPVGENTGRPLVILPRQLTGQVQSVSLLDDAGNVTGQGNFRHMYETGGGIYDLPSSNGTRVRVILENGQTVDFGGGGSSRNEGGPIGQGSVGSGGSNKPGQGSSGQGGNMAGEVANAQKPPWWQDILAAFGPATAAGAGNAWINNQNPDGSLRGAQVTVAQAPRDPMVQAGMNAGNETLQQWGERPGPQQGNQAPLAQAGGTVVGATTASQLPGFLSTPGPAAAPAAASAIPATTASAGQWPAMAETLGWTGEVANASPVNMSSAPPATAGSWYASIAPYLQGGAVAAIGAYTASKGYEALKNSEFSSKNPITGLKEGIKAAGPLNFVPVLGQLPWAAGALGAMFGSGKDKDQHARDAVRGELVQTGFLNPDYTFTLPDGTAFDFGKDGNAQLPNSGVDPLTGKDWRHYYDVDWSKEGSGGVVAAANPLAAAFARGDKKLTRDFAGMITNAATQGGDPTKNIQAMIQKAGLDHDKLYGLVHLMSKSQGGNLDDATADAYKNGLDQMYGVGAYSGRGGLGTPDIQPGQKPQPQQPQPVQQAPGPQQGNRPGATVLPQAVPQPAQPNRQQLLSQVSRPGVASSPSTGNVQQATKSPFISSPLNQGGGVLGRQRISPGVYQDDRGTYKSKTGQRGG